MPSAAVIRQKVWLLRSSSVGSLMKEEMERKEGRFCPPFRIYLKEKKSQAHRKRKAPMTTMQMKLELIPVPVTDVDRAKAFYTEKIGFHADFDQQVREDLRFVQLTPAGSACSIVIVVVITTMQPGSLEGLLMVVPYVQPVHQDHLKPC